MDLTTATDMDSYKLLNLALRKGGDYADLYFEQTTFHSIVLRDGEVNAASTHNEGGLGIRVVSGQNTGYAYTESSLPRDREEAARTASHIAQGLIRTSQPAAIATLNLPDRYRIVKPWEEFSPQEKMPFLYDLNDRIFSADKRVKKVTAQLSDSTSQIEIYNSLGIHCADIRPMASLSVSCVMESGGQRESASSSRSFRMGGEFLTPGLIEELAREIIDRTSFLFGAKQPNGGEMPVVMAAGGSGILLHEAIGHAFEADFARKKVSIFSDMMGKRVCSPGITVIDDGTIAGNRGSLNVDDEGVPGQKTYMVTDGILTSFLHDRISARYFQSDPTGNGRRESFRYMPLPRMRATYMDNGRDKEEALIASVKKGLYVDTFSNGQVQIGAGDFTFYVKSGYLIENGKLTQPIKDTNIIGNGPEALARITGVANNCVIDDGTWTCGKEQSCAVSCGMPSVLVSSLTVGGRV
ncbi:MAG TPA: TldD/PmbA family protein [Bacteroidales bacterium]|nr:TldD/PmbA family protein [Bacteroidales bacterium]